MYRPPLHETSRGGSPPRGNAVKRKWESDSRRGAKTPVTDAGRGFFLRLLRGAGGWMVGPPPRIERALILLVRGHDVDGPRVGWVRRSARRRGQRRIRAARRSEREELRRWRGADSWDAARDDGGSRGRGRGGARRRRTVDWYEAVLHDDDDASAAPGRGWTRVKYKHRSAGGNPAKTRRERRRDGMHERGDPPRGTRAQLRAVLDDIFEEHARGFRDESPFASSWWLLLCRARRGSRTRRRLRLERVRGARLRPGRASGGGFGRERAAFDDFFGSDSEFDDTTRLWLRLALADSRRRRRQSAARTARTAWRWGYPWRGAGRGVAAGVPAGEGEVWHPDGTRVGEKAAPRD